MQIGDSTSFLMIVGAPKSATTTLANWLARHPEMVLTETKEPRFFTDFGQYTWTGPAGRHFSDSLIRDEETYFASFAEKADAHWAVDASTDYLWCEAAPDKILAWSRRFNTKLICVLRDPVDRAFSEYQHSVRDNYETETFARSLDLEAQRIADHWHPLFYHCRRSRYNSAVNRYQELFGDSLMIMDFREFFDPERCAAKVSSFLGLQTPVEPSGERENASFVYRRPGIARIVKSPLAVRVGRALVPKAMRKSLRAGLDRQIATQYQRSTEDVNRLRALLADEIEACKANPLIPTDGWSAATGEGA